MFHMIISQRRIAAAISAVVLAGCAYAATTALPAWGHHSSPARPAAMSPECRSAYVNYILADDGPEADFWAESWVVFGCESGGFD